MRSSQVNRRTLLSAGVGAGAALTVGPVFSVSQASAAAADEKPIQEALDKARDAGGGQVVVGAGRWDIVKTHLRIYANTRLTLSPGSRLVRTGALSAMLCNGVRDGSDTTTKAYDGPGNIIVEGGIWDANARAVPTPGWAIVFAHARDITVRDLEIRDVSEWHAIEFNSTFNGTVAGCRLIGSKPRPSGEWNQEAVSFDLAAPGLQPFGAGDNTQSAHIRIVDNYCTGWPTFAGCHTGAKDGNHSEIVVTGNTAHDLTYWGVSMRNASGVVISDNVLSDVGGGIWLRPHIVADAGEGRPVSDIVVTGNVVRRTTSSDGIRLIGETAGGADARIHDANVNANTVSDAAAHGIALQHTPYALVSGNIVRRAKSSGITVTGGSDQQVGSNVIVDSGPGGHGIRLAGVTNAAVQANKVASTAAGSRPAYAISSDSASAGTFCTNNDLRGGFATAALDLQGTAPHTDPGNLTT